MTQTLHDIQAILTGAGIRPLKRFGQNFLIDGNLMRKLIAAAEIQPNDVVLEVGIGTGSLTENLLEASGYVVGVEIDRGLQTLAKGRFQNANNFTLIGHDILARKSVIAPDVLQEVTARRRELKGRILLVANLPYQVATPLVMNLLLGDVLVSPMCFTVQSEVAERVMAKPAGKEYGPLSILAQALAGVKRIARVPPGAFWPAPKVHSTMLRLDAREDRPSAAVREKLSFVVHACFNQRRKTMRSSLRGVLDEALIERIQKDGRWDLSRRPEELSVTQWVEFAEFLSK